MKCKICGKVAEYMDKGNSYCKKHLPNKRTEDRFVKLIEDETPTQDFDPLHNRMKM